MGSRRSDRRRPGSTAGSLLHRCVADVELGYSLCVCRGDNGRLTNGRAVDLTLCGNKTVLRVDDLPEGHSHARLENGCTVW